MSLLKLHQLKKYFYLDRGSSLFSSKNKYCIKAVDDVNLQIEEREILGLVGESGCGKTTLSKLCLRLLLPTSGSILLKGENILSLPRKVLSAQIQIVFQNPYNSLNPRQNVAAILLEPLKLHLNLSKIKAHRRIYELLETVHLSVRYINRYPHELSGGERQRICIARALAINPKLIFLDEATSNLDASVAMQIIELLLELYDKNDLTYVFISHDLRIIDYVATKVAVMYLGKIVEYGSKDAIFSSPMHPYTELLLKLANLLRERKKTEKIKIHIDEEFLNIPIHISVPRGCKFYPRCYRRDKECLSSEPQLLPHKNSKEHLVACHKINET